jgi:VWFA-related protein
MSLQVALCPSSALKLIRHRSRLSYDGRGMRRAIIAIAIPTFLLAPACAAQSRPDHSTPMVDWSEAELRSEIKDLAGVSFGARPGRLAEILLAAGTQASDLLAAATSVTATEEVHTMRFSASGVFESDDWTRSRHAIRSGTSGPSNIADPANLLEHLLPRYQKHVRFRYLGLALPNGREEDVLAFAANPDTALGAGLTPFQALVWFDAATHHIVRLRAAPLPGARPGQPSLDVEYRGVRFASGTNVSWLPVKAAVTTRPGGTEVCEVHRFTEFRISGDARESIVEDPSAYEPDARENLVNGIVLLREHKPAEATVALRAAARLDPASAENHYKLGVALEQTGDLAGAALELRMAVELTPDIAEGHRVLGALLFRLGDAAGAQVQFREVIRLDGGDAAAHANLGEALAMLGDRHQAAEEYQRASALAPENAALKARLDQLRQSAPAQPATQETQFKVEVRQVLVPVVVTDAERHTVTGLRQADFQIFEDGVEQKVSGFSVERSEGTSPIDSPGTVPAAVKVSAPGRTYMIVVDALHAQFGNLGRVRDSLARLFEREEPGDVQYVLVALGAQSEVLQQSTREPKVILAALEKHKFEGVITRSRASSDAAAIAGFQRAVEAVRRSCDSSDPLERAKCESGKQRILLQAEIFTEQARASTVNYLHGLRALVESLGRLPGRRTMILISDGFPLTPGTMSFGLIAAQFPELRAAALRGMDRLQSDFEPVLRAATALNIPISSIDARGLYASPAFDASSHGDASPRPAGMNNADVLAQQSGDSLAEMAAATGGLFIHNTNGLLQGMERVIADGRSTYVLAYVSTNGALDGKFRAITVKLRDRKLTVRAKRGYWAAPETQ